MHISVSRRRIPFVMEVQFLAIEAKHMPSRRMEIMHGDRILCRLLPQLIRDTISESWLDAGAGQPAGV